MVRDVCGAFPDSVFMHYNTARVGRMVNGALYREITAAVPNLVATKTMTGDLATVAGVVRDAPELMHFLTEQSIAYGSLFGPVALLGTFGALAPSRSWALLEAANAGRHREAAEIGSWFARLNAAIFDPLMVDRRVDGAYDKTIEKLSHRPGRLSAADVVTVSNRLGRGVRRRAAGPPRAVPGTDQRTRVSRRS